MNIEEIKKNKPDGANCYHIEEYFQVDYWKLENNKFYLWDGEAWSLYPYQDHKSLSFIKPL